SSGATIRAVYEVKSDYIEMKNVIPGGQSGSVFTPHYSDQMDLWVANETLTVHFSKEKLEGNADSCAILKPL
ncbi:MAG: penicillin acylase family protein, partial [Deltaproteobacteria bacterium]|nr:penicillin acylase family protein [Deltaproteobacteria bacterium]